MVYVFQSKVDSHPTGFTGLTYIHILLSLCDGWLCVVMQAHLKKLFAGIHSVGFGEEEREIVSMKSLEGEEVPLSRAVPITPDVEVRGR